MPEIHTIPVPQVTTQFDKTDTTLADITGLSQNLYAGRTYIFEAVLFTASDVAAGIKFAIAGTATATNIIYQAIVYDPALTVAPGTTRATALATTVGDITAVTVAHVRIVGLIKCNAAGTLTVQFAQNVDTATSSILVGSYFNVQMIT